MLTKKKGQSLVEVVVALGILAIVLSGTITLLENVITLNLEARDVTQATALAQEGIARAVGGIKAGCAVSLPSSINEVRTLGGKQFDLFVTSEFVSLGTGGGSPSPSGSGLFVRVTSEVQWQSKNGDMNTHNIVELVRREN